MLAYGIMLKSVKLGTTIPLLYSLSAANVIFVLDGLKSAQIPKMQHTSLKKVRKRRMKIGIQRNMADSRFMVCHKSMGFRGVETDIDVVTLRRHRGTFRI